MKLNDFKQEVLNAVQSNSIGSKTKFTTDDVCKLVELATRINAVGKFEESVQIGEDRIRFSDLKWPKVFAELIFPTVLTPTGDLYEADFLCHDFKGMIDDIEADFTETKEGEGEEVKVIPSHLKPIESESELIAICARLYNSFRKSPELVAVSELRMPSSLTMDQVRRCAAAYDGTDVVVPGSMKKGCFPLHAKCIMMDVDFESLDKVDKAIKMWCNTVILEAAKR